MKYLRGISVLAAALFLLLAPAGCGSGDNESEEGGSTTIGGMKAELHGTKDVSGETGKVEIEMYDDYFEPTILKPDGYPRTEERGGEPAHVDHLRRGRRHRSAAWGRGRGGRHVPAERRTDLRLQVP